MVKDIKSYISSDPAVKAARKKLADANKKLDAANQALSKSKNATPDVIADINKAITEAQAEQSDASDAVTYAENAASDYYQKNYKSISVKEGKKSLAGLEAALAQAKDPATAAKIKEDIAKTKENIANPQDYVPPSPEGKGGKSRKGGKGPQGSVGNPAEEANKQLAKLGENKTATNFISSMDDTERLNLAKTLRAAGYNAPETGKYNRPLVEAYQSALSDTINENSFNKDVKDFAPYTLTNFLAYKTSLGNLGGQGKTYTESVIFDDTRAANYINNEMQQLLGRDATPKEVATLTTKLRAAQKAKPDKITKDANGNIVRKPGVDPTGFLDIEIKKLPSVDKNLTEYQKKELDKAAATATKVVDTARANGILYDDNQLRTWTERIKNGESPSAIQNEIRLMASHGRPEAIAKQLQAGNDLSTILSPYKQYMQQILEIPENQIDLNDKTLQAAISGEKPMSLYEYQNALRKDPRWQYTNNARTAVADSVQKILQDFGFMG